MAEWRHNDVWSMEGKNFMVQITRHSVSRSSFSDPEDGLNRWCVYAYIYPGHVHFGCFDDSEDMRQDAANALPLHCGPSFYRKHVDFRTKTVCSHQVGADYSHLYDDNFSRCSTKDEARDVFSDAQELFDWLAARTQNPEAA